jgi:energy-converting hydrogenase Eha subunit C
VGLLLPLLMFAGCMLLWIGVPILWLWVGSQIEAATDLGIALAAAMAGSITTIILLAWGLAWLNRRHIEWRLRRDPAAAEAWDRAGDDERQTGGVLEPMIVATAALAVALFAVWFLFFAGASPVPLNIGY